MQLESKLVFEQSAHRSALAETEQLRKLLFAGSAAIAYLPCAPKVVDTLANVAHGHMDAADALDIVLNRCVLS